MRLASCFNHADFRRLAERRLPGPIFNYIDGAADDEVTLRRNTESFEACDLVPNVLRGVEEVDLSVRVMGQDLAVPFYCSPTALQRLFHHRGENAVAAASERFGTMFGVSSLGTVSLEEVRTKHATPQAYQFYFHKDRGLNRAMLERAKNAGVDVMMMTVDTITGGNRERDLRTGFSIPFRLTIPGMAQFALKPAWAFNHFTHEGFRLPQLEEHVDTSQSLVSISRYFSEMLDQTMNWDDVAEMVKFWDGQFCLKGVMSVEDAKARGRYRLHRHHSLESRRPTARRLARGIRPACRGRGCRGRSDRRHDGRRRPAGHACVEGPVAWRQGRWDRALLPLSAGGRRSSGGRARAFPHARRGRTRHETNGVHLDRPAFSRSNLARRRV